MLSSCEHLESKRDTEFEKHERLLSGICLGFNFMSKVKCERLIFFMSSSHCMQHISTDY